MLYMNTISERCSNTVSALYCQYLPVLLWMGIIFIFSDQEGLGGSKWHVSVAFLLERKLAHVVEYMILTALLFRLFRFHFPKRVFISVVGAFLVAVAYAFSDEWHQTFVAGREGKLSDVVIDATGMIAAVALLSSERIRRILRIQ